MADLQPGEYKIASSRKGTFYGTLESQSETWATFTITHGEATAMLDYNERGVGEQVTVRKSHCHFTQIAPGVSRG